MSRTDYLFSQLDHRWRKRGNDDEGHTDKHVQGANNHVDSSFFYLDPRPNHERVDADDDVDATGHDLQRLDVPRSGRRCLVRPSTRSQEASYVLKSAAPAYSSSSSKSASSSLASSSARSSIALSSGKNSTVSSTAPSTPSSTPAEVVAPPTNALGGNIDGLNQLVIQLGSLVGAAAQNA